MPVIEIKNLSFSYSSDANTLNNISLSIEKGSFVSIVGHNGCGKSTLAKLLIGLLTPDKGEIYVDGELLTAKSLYSIRSKMALVFQNPDNQFIGVTVEDDIAFGLENKRVPTKEMQAIIEEYAKEVWMIDFLKKEPANLSGGQKQRVAIAGALSLVPSILILDEATSMLDPKGKKDIRALISKMKKNNPDLTVISITHDIEEAYESDEVIVMHKGEVLAFGNPKEILNKEEIVLSSGMDKPFILLIKEKLKERGLDIKTVDNLDQLVEELCLLK